VLWLALAVIAWWYGRMSGDANSPAHGLAGATADRASTSSQALAGSRDDRRAWMIVAALLVTAGVISPDSIGAAHGEFLPQRLVLLGLVALVPAFDVNLRRWPGRITVAALAAAVALQSVRVWDYAIDCDVTAGHIIRAADMVGRPRRIVTLLTTTRGRFRA